MRAAHGELAVTWVREATREYLEDFGVGGVLAPYRVVGRDFNRDTWWFARKEIAPVVRAWFAWRQSRWRFCIERALSRRVLDKPEGHAWTAWTWKVRAPRR